MATITGISAYNLKDGDSGTAALDIIAKRVFTYLYANSIGAVRTSVGNTTGFIQGGTSVWRFPHIAKMKDYTPNAAQVPETGAIKEITINLNITQTAVLTFETLDLSRLINGAEYQGIIVSSIGTSMAAVFDAELINFMNNYNIANNQFTVMPRVGTAPNDWSYMDPDYTDTTNIPIDGLGFQGISARLKGILGQFVSDLNKKMSSLYIGLNAEEFLGVTSIATKNILTYSLNPFTATDLQRRSSKNLTVSGEEFNDREIFTFNGITMFTSPLMYNNIAAVDNPFMENKAYDFSNVGIIIYHKEAIANPMNAQQMMKQPDNGYHGNYVIIFKIQYGIGGLRQELMHSFLFASPTVDSIVKEVYEKGKIVSKKVTPHPTIEEAQEFLKQNYNNIDGAYVSKRRTLQRLNVRNEA